MARDARQSLPLPSLAIRRAVPYVLFFVACLLSVGASWYVSSTTADETKIEFQDAAQETRHQIELRLNIYFELARAAGALLSSSNEISRTEFRSFVAELRLRDGYPGLDGIGFAERVAQPRLRAFVRELELDGSPLHVWPQGDRAEYDPVVFLEPADARSHAMVGFDLASNPSLVDAMDRARDTGKPIASPKLSGVPPFDEGAGRFVLFVPVYRAEVSLATVDDRRKASVGFVLAPFDIAKLFRRIAAEIALPVTFEVYDSPPARQEALLSEAAAGMPPGKYTSAQVMPVAGRNWLIIISSRDGLGLARVAGNAGRWLGVGLLLSVLLLIVTRSQVAAWEAAARREVEAKAADRAKEEFLTTISHELRTPLNAIVGWTGLLRSGALPEAKRTHALDVIERNAQLQSQLINDLLDVSRIAMGTMRLDLRVIEADPIVRAVVDSLRPVADSRGVELKIEPGDGAAPVRADANRLQQIVWNVISNAIKFTPQGGAIAVSARRRGEFVELVVRDNGIGIAPEFLPHVFERFRQADSSVTRPQAGVGLGLAIVKQLVELQDGAIDVKSEGAGKGSTVTIRLPLSKVAAPSVLHGVRVLVADDDQQTREMLCEALGARGATVTAATSADEAFNLLGSGANDVLISDIGMPGEDGYSLMRRIRSLESKGREIPAIALSGFAGNEDRARAVQAGFQMHFAKPVELDALERAIADLAPPH